jgi:hypothetical protein
VAVEKAGERVVPQRSPTRRGARQSLSPSPTSPAPLALDLASRDHVPRRAFRTGGHACPRSLRWQRTRSERTSESRSLNKTVVLINSDGGVYQARIFSLTRASWTRT